MSALHIRIGRGASRLPAEIALALIPSLPRPHLERLVQQLIDRMDEADGDTDIEANGDELDGGNCEDDFGAPANWLLGPGCPISDSDMCAVECGRQIGGEP